MPIASNPEGSVSHFGIALATITLTVIGGAVVLDRVTSSDKPTAQSSTTPRPAPREAIASEASTNGNSTTALAAGDTQPPIASAPADSRPADPAPAKPSDSPKKLAAAPSSPKASRKTTSSTRTIVASAGNTQAPWSEAAPSVPMESVAPAQGPAAPVPSTPAAAPAPAAAAAPEPAAAQAASAPAQSSESTANAAAQSQEERKPAQ